MTNQNYLLLLQDIELWNEWRIGKPDIIPNLAHADLRGQNLQGANLSGVNLFRTNLSEANLNNANLSKAYLRNAKLTKAKFKKANCYQTTLTEADLSNAYVVETDLSKANFSSANLSNANLSESYLISANLTNADLTHANLMGSYLTQADLTQADLTDTNLTQADLTKIQATYANFTNSILTGVCLEDWLIDETTKLDQVFCRYFYPKANQKKLLNNDVQTSINLSEILKQSFDSGNINAIDAKKQSLIHNVKLPINSQEKILEWENMLKELYRQKTEINSKIDNVKNKLEEYKALI